MALPLSRSGECAASELASILAGTVMNQKTIPPAVASSAMASNNRRIGRAPGITGGNDQSVLLGSALLRLAIGVVAVSAGSAHVGKCHFEFIERLRLVLIVGDRFCEGCDLRVKVGLVFPNLRQGSGFLPRCRRRRE